MTVVTGTVEMSNGDSPDLLMVIMGNMRDLKLDYIFRIVGKQITVEFEDLPTGINLKQIMQISRQIADMVLMPLIINNGIALNYHISACWTEDGEYHNPSPDQTPIGADFNTDQLSINLALHAKMRQAIRDFNQGLMVQENSPVNFYRSLECMVGLVCGISGHPSDDNWRQFHDLTGTNPEDAAFILDKADKQFIGGTSLSAEEHTKLMALIQRYINKTLEFVTGSGIPQ